MVRKSRVSLAALCLVAGALTPAGAGALPDLGSGAYGQWSGTVQQVYYRSQDRFAILLKDGSSTKWLFSKAGSQMLSVILAQKASGSQTRIVYTRNSANYDQNSCIDIVYEQWVCDEARFVYADQ